ncbi:MAG: rod shape-determining protein MreC [Elusimicrobiaceae bacterium]|nr:rod shape-determining protein MreC [Elusimicrobiaceae bacterium]
MKQVSQTKKQMSSGSRRRKILPGVFVFVSLLLMVLPLEGPVSSVKAVLSYVFIPQIRAAHETVEYAKGVSDTVQELLDTHRENERLKEQLRQMQLQNEQAREIFKENARLNTALTLQAPASWNGVWAKTAYREPSQWNSVVVDKGTASGVQERSAVIAQQGGQPVLAGVVVEVTENTAKVLLLRDEDFSAVVYADPSGEEGLLTGSGAALPKMKYLPLLSTVKEGETVYTSSASSIFPAGILVGKIAEIERTDGINSSLTARVEPAVTAAAIQELFILTHREETK